MLMAYLFLNRGSSLLWLCAQHTKNVRLCGTLLQKNTLQSISEIIVFTTRSGYLGFPAVLHKHSFWMKLTPVFQKCLGFLFFVFLFFFPKQCFWDLFLLRCWFMYPKENKKKVINLSSRLCGFLNMGLPNAKLTKMFYQFCERQCEQ